MLSLYVLLAAFVLRSLQGLQALHNVIKSKGSAFMTDPHLTNM